MPDDAEIIDAVSEGNLVEMRRLLETGEASLNDRTRDGQSLLL